MPEPKELPSQETILACLDYFPNSGILLWKPRPESKNFRFGGKPALAHMNKDGYMAGYWSAAGGGVKAHRVIWKMITGSEPDKIDHINGIRSDNRIINLRSVSTAENARNLGVQKNNTSGFNGVYWYPRYQKWMVSIRVNGARKTIGYFAKKADAIAARISFDKSFGYTIRSIDK